MGYKSGYLASSASIFKKVFVLTVNLFIYLFLERGREGGGRKREKSMCGCLSSAPYWGPGPQPRPVPWLGIDPLAHRLALSPLSHTSQGNFCKYWIDYYSSLPPFYSVLMFFKHAKHASTLRTLNLMFPLSSTYSSPTLSHYWLSSFWSQLKYHLNSLSLLLLSSKIASLSFPLPLSLFHFSSNTLYISSFVYFLSVFSRMLTV